MWANDSSYFLKENLYGLLKIIIQIYINECLKTTVKKNRLNSILRKKCTANSLTNWKCKRDLYSNEDKQI